MEILSPAAGLKCAFGPHVCRVLHQDESQRAQTAFQVRVLGTRTLIQLGLFGGTLILGIYFYPETALEAKFSQSFKAKYLAK